MANYEINKDYISKNLCENRSKPKMHCNGKCHLRKQLQKESKKENAPANNVKNKLEIQFFSESNSLIQFIAKPTDKDHFINYYFIPYSKHIVSVFRPPQA